MLEAVDKLPLTEDLARKFLQNVRKPNKQKLLEELNSNFEKIFILVK